VSVGEGNQLTEKPRLRWPLDVQRHQHRGEEFIVLSCPLGLSEEPAIFSARLMPVIFSLDGATSLEDISGRFAEEGLSQEMLEKLLSRLNEFHLLDTAETNFMVREAFEQYQALKVRPPSHAGFAYPEDPEKIKPQIREWFDAVQVMNPRKDKRPLVSVVPHIDYGRGWHCYADLMKDFSAVDGTTLFLFGTSHQPGESLFRLTKKDFLIPGHQFETCQESVAGLASGYGEQRSFVDELVHRKEHSIELMLPFLQQRVEGVSGLKIVPVLVGSFNAFLGGEREPTQDDEFRSFVDTLREIITSLEAKGKPWQILAGLDMAHTGLAFGDPTPVAPSGLAALEDRDREYIRLAEGASSCEFLAHLAEDMDARRICGYPSLFTIFSLFEALDRKIQGELLSYHQAVEETSDTIVTFSSMRWYDEG